MRTEVINADTIDEAADEILKVLKEDGSASRSVSGSSRDNVIYFDGWDGLGASAVLRAVARRVSPPAGRQGAPAAGLEFDQVVHIDCSAWESRRALQRAVAEQLKLPGQVMALLDRQDEEDDFRGVPQGSRAEVPPVVEEMYRHIRKLNCRFLVIFHNGSGEEIDLASLCGFPLFGFSTNKVLWTFQGRFRLEPRAKVDTAIKSAGATNAFLSAASPRKEQDELWPYLVNQEALEMVETCKTNNTGIMDLQPAQVVECFLYIMELHSHSIDYDLATHSANYWVCEGILQQLQQGERGNNDGADDGFWRAVDALQGEMRLDADYHQFSACTHLARFVKSRPYWSSPTHGFTRVPAGVILNGDMLQLYLDKLAVLKISRCTFSFQSPPFCHCHSLRFLWLDHCQDSGISTDGVEDEEAVRRFFQRLWVLDVRYTCCDQILSAKMMCLMDELRELNVMGCHEWDMGQLQGRLPNIRKLRITKSKLQCSCSEDDLFSEMNKMELLDFSGNGTNPSSPVKKMSALISTSSSCLETVIVDGCEADLQRMSFRGCTKLKNLLLGGLMYVDTLDVSGTAVKTLDLSAITEWWVDEFRLLDCDKLCAILWPRGPQSGLFKLRIDTTQSASSSASYRRGKQGQRGSTVAATQTTTSAAPHDFGWDISVRDPRLLFSLESVYHPSREGHVEVSSPARPTVVTANTAGCSKDEAIKSGSSNEQNAPAVYADDTTVLHLQQAIEGQGQGDPPDTPSLGGRRCYMHIQDRIWTKAPAGGGESSTITVPDFVIDSAKILHVHDCLSITAIPSGTMQSESEWFGLKWCRIERCPKLESVFTNPEHTSFLDAEYQLETLWASQLLKALYICKWNERSGFLRGFSKLRYLHLDHCPRLIHALPMFKEQFQYDRDLSLHRLETIEIMWCGDLKEVFPLNTDQCDQFRVPFRSLKRIHLHELPSLQRICGGGRMFAPYLETVKIRGCWSLTRLPDVSGGSKAVECNCEKEWWDRLEWDGDSRPSHYKPTHSRYYKKTMLRGSVLA